MRTEFVAGLVLISLAACERKPTQAPDDEPRPRAGYGELMWAESTSIQPIEVCEQLGRVVAAEAGSPDAPIDPALLAQCEADMRIEAGIRGTDGWNVMANCVMNSRTEADIDYCDRTYPLPEGGPKGGSSSGGPSIVAVSERELEVCDHMIDVLMLEAAAASGEVPPVTVDERRTLVEDCAQSFVIDQKPGLSPADYEALLSCVEAAPTSEKMRDCE